MAVPCVGDRLEETLVLDAAAIRAGATLVGDSNPLHHDAAFAAASRFGGLIASGAHTCALLAGMAARGFGVAAAGEGVVGVEYDVRFQRPVRADQALRLEWVVVALEPRRSGTLARLEGGILDARSGAVVVSATMAVLHLHPSRNPA